MGAMNIVGIVLGLIFSSIFPLLFLVIIRTLDFYQTGRSRSIWISFGWGMLACVLAFLINRSLQSFGLLDRDTIIRFEAPVLEEILKGLVLLYWIRRREFSYSVDGALYGFATGIGFAILENFEYVTRDLSLALLVALQRIFSATLVHASSSAVVGIGLGMFRLEKSGARWLFLMAGLFLGVGQHMFYNQKVSDGTSLAIAFGIGILGMCFIYSAMQYGRNQAQTWIREKLGMNDRVTRGEVAVIDRLVSPDEVLLPVYERFGAQTATRLERLLYHQARLGIKHKILESVQDNDGMRTAMEAEISAMQAEMEAVRRAIGVYAMLFVRGLFTEEMVSVWDQVQAKIQERSAESGGQKAGGLWSSLEKRVKPPKDEEERLE